MGCDSSKARCIRFERGGSEDFRSFHRVAPWNRSRKHERLMFDSRAYLLINDITNKSRISALQIFLNILINDKYWHAMVIILTSCKT